MVEQRLTYEIQCLAKDCTRVERRELSIIGETFHPPFDWIYPASWKCPDCEAKKQNEAKEGT